MMTRPWTDKEDELLREHFPPGGVEAVAAAFDEARILPRSQTAVYIRAHRMGLREESLRPAPTKALKAELSELDIVSLRRVVGDLQVAIDWASRDLSGYLGRLEVALGELNKVTRND